MELAAPPPPLMQGRLAVLLAAIIFVALSLIAAAASDGFLDADAATHFVIARHALHDLPSLTNVWGRPLVTGLFTIPAAVAGRFGVRVVSLLCALSCALIAWRLAILQRYRWPALAAIFTLGQPLLFLYSFSEMTELPFAALAGLAFLSYRKRKWWLLAFLASLLPLARPEGFAFCLLAALALVCHRRAVWLLLLPIPVVAWNYVGWFANGEVGPWPTWIIHNWPYAATSDYPSGPLWHFVMELPVLVSPVALPAVLIGVALAFKLRLTGPNHSARCQWLIAFIPSLVLVVHSLLFWLGRFSSDGEMRYLLIAAPFWGLLAAFGWEWAFAARSPRLAVSIAAIGLLLPALIDLKIPIVPVHLTEDWRSARRLIDWYNHNSFRQEYPHLVSSHPAFDYYLDVPATAPIRANPFNQNTILSAPAGCVLVWDEHFSTRNADPSRDATPGQILYAGWKEIAVPKEVGWKWRIFLSRPQPRQ